jgi:hypothetical protein
LNLSDNGWIMEAGSIECSETNSNYYLTSNSLVLWDHQVEEGTQFPNDYNQNSV